MSTTSTPPAAPPFTPWPRIIGVGVALAALVAIIVLAFSWPTTTSSVKDLPVAIAGPDAAVTQVRTAIDEKAPDTFAFSAVADRAAAVDLIKERKAYGAIVLGAAPEVLTASAASTTTTQIITGVATQLQAQLTSQGSSATVTVTDVVPLSDTDPRGVGLLAAAFPLVLGGMLGGILISVLVVGAWRRLVTLFVYTVVAGAGLAAIMHYWLGSIQGNYFADAGAIALAFLAMGATIVGFSSLVGRAGVAIGPVLFLLIGNPLSAASLPVEFLARPWGQIGQFFPPGAAATLLRDLSYFPDASTSFPWLTLGIWSLVGIAFGLVGHFRTVIEVESEPEPAPAI